MTTAELKGANTHRDMSNSTVVPRTGGRAPNFLAAGTVLIGLALVMLIGLSGSSGELGAATVGSLAVYGLLLAALFISSPRFVCVGNVFGVFWAIWFPLRLLVIQSDRNAIALNPVVRTASDGQLAVVWLLSLLGFAAFTGGVLLVRRRRGNGISAPRVPDLPRSTYLFIAVVGLLAAWAQAFAHVQSGILGIAGNIYLLGIAGAAFIDARDRRWSWAVPMLVGVAALLGAVTSFKAAAIAPVLAWAIGSVLGGLRISRLRILLAVIIALGAFAGVQGERLAQERNPITGARVALFDYDLTTGLPAHQPNVGAAFTNLLAGVMNRTAGADALLIVRAKTPAVIGFQGGRTLWQPAASVVPGAKRLLDPDLRQLSLGRYFTTKFWSVDPTEDPSSQAITMPGDFYLNFGALGVAFGMLAVGLLVGLLERRFPSGTAFGAGVLAYVGISLVTVESNVAYALVTAGIGLGVVFALLLFLGLAETRRRPLTHADTGDESREHTTT